MLKKIHLENFKCFKKVTVEPNLITVFIGPNGSGKSSVLQALVLLKQTVQYFEGENRLHTDGPLLNLGQFQDIVFGKIPNVDVVIQYGGTLPLSNVSILDVPTQEIVYGYKARFTSRYGLGDLSYHELGVQAGHFKEHYHVSAGGEKRLEPYDPNKGWQIGLATSSRIGQPITVGGGSVGEDQSQYEKARNSLESILYSPRNAIRDYFFFTPANRDIALPEYPVANKTSDDLLSATHLARRRLIHELEEEWIRLNLETEAGRIRDFIPEALLDTTGLALATVLDMSTPSIKAKVQQWSKEITQTEVRPQLGPGPKEAILSRNFNVINEGFGSNTLVYLLTQLAIAPQNSTIAMEEPEIHLHPKAQAQLADVLVKEATEEDKQLIVTTHSEHILFSLLTAVAEGRLKPNQLAIYSFEKKKGIANAKPLKVNKDGTVEGGLAGFFEAELEGFQRYLSALSKDK